VEFDVHEEERQELSRLLQEPLTCDQILIENYVPTSFQHQVKASSRDGVTPPLIVHTPGFDDRYHSPARAASHIVSRGVARVSICLPFWCFSDGHPYGIPLIVDSDRHYLW
jgi:hypothetical protein